MCVFGCGGGFWCGMCLFFFIVFCVRCLLC